MHMRRQFLATIAALTLVLLPFGSFAASGHGSDLDSTVGRIMTEQGVTQRSDIDCAKVSNDDFASLGDAFMGLMHPDEQEHELMDNMMGGEGSKQLESAHILMGKRYLDCVSGSTESAFGTYGMMSGMMGAGPWMMNGYGGSQDYGMMGYGAGWSFGWLMPLLLNILLILGIVWVVRELFRPRKK